MKSLLRAEELSGLSLTVIDETMAQFRSQHPTDSRTHRSANHSRGTPATTSVVIADRHVDLVFYGMRIPGLTTPQAEHS